VETFRRVETFHRNVSTAVVGGGGQPLRMDRFWAPSAVSSPEIWERGEEEQGNSELGD